MLFQSLRAKFGVMLAGLAAAASGVMVSHSVTAPKRPAQTYRPGVVRGRGYRPSIRQERHDWGVTQSWTGARNKDNPAGTKLRKKVTEQALTLRKGW